MLVYIFDKWCCGQKMAKERQSVANEGISNYSNLINFTPTRKTISLN